jgi:tetrahydrodipicolinate N-succinyltransferase
MFIAEEFSSDGVTVMSGLSIGDGAVIGAGAIVTKDVEPYQIVAGIPAKLIRNRFKDEIKEKLLESRWWDKSFSDLKRVDFSNVELFLLEVEKVQAKVKYKKILIKNRSLHPIK